ncbi:MAG: hypothetical protein OEM62_02005 [Acidobacteriota bacterium]|nr:hypothetical protein [Acidobacteriota bacterium]
MRSPPRNHEIMKNVYHRRVEHGGKSRHLEYVAGASIAGFVKVPDAMLASGTV